MTPATPAVRPSPSQTGLRVIGRRQDIQALRALAVILVVLFHLWPKRMPGGYVGVDVFFVLSGFLITSHLIKAPPRNGRDVVTFWARRIRRLLPAAFAVIVVTSLASWTLLPETQWRSLARDAVASASYMENWNLAGGATDYLAAESASSPFQHFWSLSVEEQFYILWPLLILGAVAVAAARARSATVTVAVMVAAVFAASLAASILVTGADPAAAYFVTHTRMWEPALGGLLAVGIAARPQWFTWPSAVRSVVAWTGLAAIVWSAFAFTGATSFPGTAALVPTLGAATFVAARSETGRWSPQRIGRAAPVQFAGDVSYSMYLWHWPIIVIAPFATGTDLTAPMKVLIFAATLAIAWASKKWIEDPPQRSSHLARPTRAVGFAVVGMVGVIAIGGAQSAVASIREEQANTRLAAAVERQKACAGARALSAAGDCQGGPHGTNLLTTPAQAALDQSDLYDDGCLSDAPFADRATCTYGERENPVARIALVGNSHAGHWLPMLQELGEERGWQITTYLASACITIDHPQDFQEAGAVEGCQDWSQWAIDSAAQGDYDLIVTSARTSRPLIDVEAQDTEATIRQAYMDTLATWTRSGRPVLVLRDTPESKVIVPDCVDEHSQELSKCDGPQASRLSGDPLAEAATATKDSTVAVADLTKYLCSDGTCYGTIGGLPAYSDQHHMTDTFARTLAPFVEPQVVRLLQRASR